MKLDKAIAYLARMREDYADGSDNVSKHSRDALDAATLASVAIHSSGISPAALAADPDCVRKLVEAARVFDSPVLYEAPHDNECEYRATEGEPSSDFDADCRVCALLIALKSCGIEVGP